MGENEKTITLEQQSFSSLIINLLTWEQPIASAITLVAINCVFWLIVSWNRRLFSILSLFALFLFCYRTWVNQIWPEIRLPPEEAEDSESWTALQPGVLSVPEVSRYLNNFCEKMLILWKDVWKLRKENHGLFCALMCGFFSILALIGKVVPGVLLIYTIVLLLSLGPGIALHLIPSTLYDQMIGFFTESDSQDSDISKSGNSDKDSDIEEFVPETSADILRQLSLQDEVPEVPSPGMVLTESGEPTSSLFSIENSINEGLCTGSLYINDPVYHDMLFILKTCINKDSKYFVDLELKRPFTSIKEDFLNILSKHNTDTLSVKQSFLRGVFDQDASMTHDVRKFCTENFSQSEDLLIPVDINAKIPEWFSTLDTVQEKMCNRIFYLWKTYYKRMNLNTKMQNSMVPLKGNLCVLGGRFNEMYYWDTYWIIIGLINCNMVHEAFEIIQTFVEMIQSIGFIPNATRTYYLNRSQPPMFTHMLDVLYNSTDDRVIHKFILNEGLEAAEKEYNYFMERKSLDHNGVLFNVYKVDTDIPRIESYTEDLVTQYMSKNKNEMFSNLATGAESGWDFSSRWFEDGKNLHKINMRNLVPVDLNAIMMKNECIIKKFYEKKQKMNAKYDEKINKYVDLISKRRQILDQLWNYDEESWNDLNIKTGKFTDNRFYFSNIFPLFFDEYSKDIIYRVLNKYHKELFGYKGGAPISGEDFISGHQWDFPNVWAPCIQLLVEYLSSMNEHKMGIHVSKSFYLSVRNEYLKTGLFFEKYDCCEVGKKGDGGEYPVQNGFGWTNGTMIYLLKKYGKKLNEDFDHHKSYEEIKRYLETRIKSDEGIQVSN